MPSRTLRFSSLGLFISLAFTTCATADPLTRTSLRAELSGFEDAPTSGAVRQWGTDGAALLMELANDGTEAPFVRARAASALRWFAPNEAVHRFLALVAAAPGDLLVRRAALDGLALGFNDTAAVAAMFDSPDADLRDGAAWALAAVNSPTSRALLDARLRVETDENVRRTITTALTGAQRSAPTVVLPTQPVRTPRTRR